MRKSIILIIIILLASCSTVEKVVDDISALFKTENEKTASEPQKEATPIKIEKETSWDESTINTVENATYLSEIEKQIVIELNRVRTKPKKYSELYLEPMRSLFRGNILQYPGEIAIRTNEGVSALNECISVLNKTKPMGVLETTEGIHIAAKVHMQDQSNIGGTGHSGSDGSSPFQRMERYGQWQQTAGENIAYGQNNAQRIVIGLLVDDGVPSRGHRKNILNTDFGVVGVSHGTHPKIRNVTVMDFAGEYKDK